MWSPKTALNEAQSDAFSVMYDALEQTVASTQRLEEKVSRIGGWTTSVAAGLMAIFSGIVGNAANWITSASAFEKCCIGILFLLAIVMNILWAHANGPKDGVGPTNGDENNLFEALIDRKEGETIHQLLISYGKVVRAEIAINLSLGRTLAWMQRILLAQVTLLALLGLVRLFAVPLALVGVASLIGLPIPWWVMLA